MDTRRSWPEYFIEMAFIAASRSTCLRGSVGAVLVKDNVVLSTGYNGAPAGMAHCIDPGVGCLLYDSKAPDGSVQVNCFAGDTLVSRYQSGNQNSGHHTIKEIFDWWQIPVKRVALQKMKVRSADSEGNIVPGNITDVWQSGIRPVLRITTSLGRNLTCTYAQLLLTPNGWVELQQLSIGNLVALNGQLTYLDEDWLRQKYLIEGMQYTQIARLCKTSDYNIKNALIKFNIPIKPLGGWNKGILGEAAHNYKGDNVTSVSAHMRAHNLINTSNLTCEICSSSTYVQRHHVDENPWNNNIDNIRILCVNCHNLAHTPHAKTTRIKYDKIVSITPAGEQLVYDMTVYPYSNFSANGIISHNCFRTIHAELNAVTQAARNGTNIQNTILYCTHSPCYHCCKTLINIGVKEMFYVKPYNIDHISELVQLANVKLIQIERR